MKYFFLIVVCFGSMAFAASVVLRDADEKPLVRNGQQEAAMAIQKAVRKAARERSEERENAAVPTAICERDSFNFGLMDPLTVGEHTFYIENRSSVDLIIWGGESTCKCTLSDLKEAVVGPGQKYPIKLTWNSGHARQEFGQSATVNTNDPTTREIQLSVFGKVRAVLAATPTEVSLDRLLPSTPASKYFSVYSQVWEDFDIERIESTSEFVTARLATSGSSHLLAADDEIANATSKHVVEITYNGQAPKGPLAGRLRLYVRPPTDWENITEQSLASEETTENASKKEGLPAIQFPVQEDGSILAEIAYYGSVVRRLGLYGKVVKSEGRIDLGTLIPKDSSDRSWTIIGRVRGDQHPSEVTASVTGIPSLVAEVESITSSQAKYSFRITLRTTEKLKPAIYNKKQSGLLSITAAGMPAGDDKLELPINLIIVKP